jgi:hypothetical protein
MKSDFSVMTSEQKRILGFILLGLIVLGAVQYYTRNKVDKEGVYVKGTVVNSEGYKGGIMSEIRYSFKDHDYQNSVHNEKKLQVGMQYLIKILSDDPNELLFLPDNPVPECLLDSNPPFEGWSKLPECK